MIYKTSTDELPGQELLYQMVFDSRAQSYFVILYRRSGPKIKHCKPSSSEQGAMNNMFVFLSEMKKGEA